MNRDIIVFIILVCSSITVIIVVTKVLTLKNSFRTEEYKPSSRVRGKPLSIFRKEEQSCYVPNLNPFEPRRMAIIHEKYAKEGYTPSCPANRRFITQWNSTNLIRVKPNDRFWNEAICYYFHYTRESNKHGSFKYKVIGSHQIIFNSTQIPEGQEFIHVQCKNRSNPHDNVGVYNDLFHFFWLKPQLERKILTLESTRKSIEKVNVVILGLDSVAQMNFIRFMPKVHDYITNDLSSHSVTIGLKGYSKVGGFTMHNLTPLFTGIHFDDLTSVCWKKHSTQSAIKECPFIWKEYDLKGYRTLYVSDDEGETFRHNIWKFEMAGKAENAETGSTDYDLMPIIERSVQFNLGRQFGFSKNGRQNRMCWGYNPKIKFLLDTSLQFFATFRERPFLQFIWESRLTHDISRMTSHADKPFLTFFKTIKENKFLNNTVFVLMSDHGAWRGENRGEPLPTPQEIIEDCMPFIYFILPKWFEDKFPTAIHNLRSNIKRLTSHFDTHETLRDLSDLSSIEEFRLHERQKDNYSNRKGISLFLPIPENRTCVMAGIPAEFCVCWYNKPSEVDDDVLWAIESVLNLLNSERQRLGSQCSHLRLSKVIQATTRSATNGLLSKLDEIELKIINIMSPHYDLTFEVLPTKTIYKAKVARLKTTWELVDDIIIANNITDDCCETCNNLGD